MGDPTNGSGPVTGSQPHRALALSDAPHAEITGRFAVFKQRFEAAQQALDGLPQDRQAMLEMYRKARVVYEQLAKP